MRHRARRVPRTRRRKGGAIRLARTRDNVKWPSRDRTGGRAGRRLVVRNATAAVQETTSSVFLDLHRMQPSRQKNRPHKPTKLHPTHPSTPTRPTMSLAGKGGRRSVDRTGPLRNPTAPCEPAALTMSRRCLSALVSANACCPAAKGATKVAHTIITTACT